MKTKKCRYFKVYFYDVLKRQRVLILKTEKKYQEVKEFFGRCEELFEEEAMAFIKAGSILVTDFSSNCS